MRSNKIMWGVVALVALITILVTTGTIDNFSQQTSINNTNKQIQDQQKDYPIVDYNAPEPTDAREREERQKKDKRYEKKGPHVVKNPDPKDDMILAIHGEPIPSPTPSAESSLIIIGEVLASKASLSNNRKGIYSEYIVRIQNILKQDKQKNFQVGKNITIDRTGGYVRYPNGQKVLYRISWQELPEVKGRYIFFLNNEDQTPNYRIVTGYQLINGNVTALDNSPYFRKFNGMNEADFIKLVLNDVAEPSQPTNN